MNSATTPSPWIKIFQPCPQPRLRFFCFHPSASGASLFRLWGKYLPSNIEVCAIQLPGRETRIKEPLITKWDNLLPPLIQALKPLIIEYPFVFFGHSLGAAICFELACQLRMEKLPIPKGLFLSGRYAPHIPIDKPVHQKSDQVLISKFRDYGGTPEAVLQNRDLMELFVPILRADLTLHETYIESGEPPFEFPIVTFRGKNDGELNYKELFEWRHYTLGSFDLHEFPGGHMFFQKEPKTLIETILKFL
ncbi:thioesterase II family protein [Dapis sp. BLCC M172]|uniref:thioesterase II family protein n=1 Tax=Dapis sp. BLCC M172 TaxID=2975281 RepID=UPI003CEAF129